MSKARILLVGLANGMSTPRDGEWVVEYDPTRYGKDVNGNETIALVRTSSNRADAKVFDSGEEAFKYWTQSYGLRPDGEPNRPLTVFSVCIDTDQPMRSLAMPSESVN